MDKRITGFSRSRWEMENKDLRQIIFEKIKNKKDKDVSSKAIFEKLIFLDAYKKAKIIFIYMSLKSEVDTSIIIKNALQDKKTVGMPAVKEELVFIKIDKDTTYKKGALGVLEPTAGEELKACDLIIVPMVAFDKKCNRMGHGKGYYDKFLADKSCYKIGIAFAEQEIDFAVFPHDIAMDMVITENNIYINNV